MPGKMSRERIRIMQSYGTEVTLVNPKDVGSIKERSISGAEIEVPGRIMCKNLEEANPKVWWARQFSNPANVEAHHETGREILAQTDGHVDAFVASLGTGGTLMGIAEVLKKQNREVKIIGIQPASSRIPIKLGKSYLKSEVVGGIICELLEKHLVDEIITIRDRDAVAAMHRLRKEEGLFVGVSSGANVMVSATEAKKLGNNATVVTVLPDSGDRYLSQEHFVT
jgi:cysteine synthase A